MTAISKISVISEKNIGCQILKDTLTPTEKKILISMLNANMGEGQVRNKVFRILKTENNEAEVLIITITHSVILNAKDTSKQKVKIKYS